MAQVATEPKVTATAPQASVIVTTRNSARTLADCLRSIRGQSVPVEVIVVDNGSTDATLDIAQGLADKVLTKGPERSAQRNAGAAAAAADYLLFIDSDMVLQPDVVSDCLAALSSGSDAAIIPEVSVGEGFWTRCRILERSCYDGDDSTEAARFFRSSSFLSVGGFDETLNGAEDWDISRRVAGRRRLPRSTAHIVHWEGRTRVLNAFRKRRYYAPGYLRYWNKHRRDDSVQANPLFRLLRPRNWAKLARHPILAAGMLWLKGIETLAVLSVSVEQKVHRTERAESGRIYV